MRVTIEHREESAGLSGNKRHYFVHCSVEFSQEELAIIKARSLYEHHFTVDGAEPPRTEGHAVGAGFLKGIAPLCIVGGFIFGLFGGGVLAGFILFGGIASWIIGFFMDQRPPGEAQLQNVTIRRLVSNPKFTMFATDPAYAKALEDKLRQDLANLKGLITESAEVRVTQTFEL
jgi:hypothetical protein